jgi:hypothetical protein
MPSAKLFSSADLGDLCLGGTWRRMGWTWLGWLTGTGLHLFYRTLGLAPDNIQSIWKGPNGLWNSFKLLSQCIYLLKGSGLRLYCVGILSKQCCTLEELDHGATDGHIVLERKELAVWARVWIYSHLVLRALQKALVQAAVTLWLSRKCFHRSDWQKVVAISSSVFLSFLWRAENGCALWDRQVLSRDIWPIPLTA